MTSDLGERSGDKATDPPARSPASDRHRQKQRRRWPRWLLGMAGTLVVLVLLGGVAFIVATRNPEPGDFYDPPDDFATEPGSILRSEPFTSGLPAGSRGWRILYTSTDPKGRPIAVSGLVIAPAHPAPGPHPVLAWAHGTTGIARPCAPSLSKKPLDGIPDMTGALDHGWIITLTDYPGLGTASPHPYLVGQSEGRAVLDSVRAAHRLDLGIDLDNRYAIWGHSQGGHAALFAGQLAPTYLPGYSLVGVAALAPATRLQQNLAAIEGTKIGNVLTIFAVEAWTDYYPDIPDGTLTARARPPARRIAQSCLNQPSRFRLALGTFALPDRVVAIDPATDPTWSRRLDANTPDPAGIAAPLFVGQGLVDEIIEAGVTEHWTADRCSAAAAGPTTWQTYAGVDHIGVVVPAGANALRWTVDRFNGVAATVRCPAGT